MQANEEQKNSKQKVEENRQWKKPWWLLKYIQNARDYPRICNEKR